MSGRLHGKRALVTGAAQGIGRAIAEAFAHEGGAIVGADRNWLHMPDAPTISAISLDLTDAAAVAAAVAEHGPFDILVNCVGDVAGGTILDTPVATLEQAFTLNVLTMTHAIRAVLPDMLARGGGAIVNIASVVSSTKAAPDRFAYGTTKAAVIGLTKSVARDFIAHGIRCNSISPGTTLSPSLEQRFAATGDVEAARAAFVARQPMGRLGDPAEMAAVAILLASDEAPFLTGADIIVDGGMSL